MAPSNTGASTAASPSPFWWRGQAESGTTAGDTVQLGFTSVEAGNLARHVGSQPEVSENRRLLETSMGVPAGSLRFLNQVHSADVIPAEPDASAEFAAPLQPAAPPPPAAAAEPAPSSEVLTGDAWVCADGSVPLAIMVADCLPVLLHGRRAAQDPDRDVPVTAAAHAGRPGLLAGVLENTVAAMRAHGADAITAWIGPGACGDCYEIPEEMVAEVSQGRPAIVSQTSWGSSALNLRAEARAVLDGQGVRVAELAGCTIEDESLFSHRRAPGKGRFAGVIWMPTAASQPGPSVR
ncbi:polyphenol oxidase family protein [Nesterenkonia jeotgali]|uniref:YfiH family protein n=1 Tax=Nesterenkonia jeotgali TaxID=317018 RepID=A0A839FR85_9MICC|nr:polyphenol oxidase family protein [Nesterenkonia jeotgali]MBA8921131.1 YfiH family protein [Nesterenkonia jeotgali]